MSSRGCFLLPIMLITFEPESHDTQREVWFRWFRVRRGRPYQNRPDAVVTRGVSTSWSHAMRVSK